ncbi:hypothetical protein ONE63_010421 [Megalurothrips usitatus]|uniref:Flocculation protein FLO11-like n=1 Tax=Megalurothrips usitatus TaxID=439358 RepID=A0AAV7XGI5_9NEOP|nr:hypothetical protein ONE63_010421 [Megalurothrips usitatus]
MPQLPLSSAVPTLADLASPSSASSDVQEETQPQTTPAPAVETTTPTLSHRLRPRIRFNSTRPRFSVKDYHGRKPGKDGESEASAPSTTAAPSPSRGRVPSRTRGSHRHTTERDSDTSTSTESSRTRYRTKDPLRFNHQRYRSTTSTTSTTTEAPPAPVPDTADAGSEVSTEKSADAKSPVLSRFRPGSGKYYSRYRTSTSTEAPGAPAGSSEGARLPQTTAASKQVEQDVTQEVQEDDEAGDNYPSALPSTAKTHIQRFAGFSVPSSPATHTETDRSDTVRDNEVLPSTLRGKPAAAAVDSAAAAPPAAPTPTAEQSTSGDLADVQIDASTTLSAEDMLLSPSQRVAELTSSPGNHYNSPGTFKSVMPASRRTPLKVSLSTDDPILPIEAFFNSWSKDQKSS